MLLKIILAVVLITILIVIGLIIYFVYSAYKTISKPFQALSDLGESKIPGCPPGYKDNNAGFCTQECPEGYVKRGAFCYKPCPPDWKGSSSLAHCQKHRIISLGVGKKHTCDDGRTVAGKGRCKGKKLTWRCEHGRTYTSGMCYEDCPSGYERRPGDIGACLSKCPPGFKDIGVGGCEKPKTPVKVLSTINVGVCPEGYEKRGGLCYPE